MKYFGGNSENILNGLLADNPFKEAVESEMGKGFPLIYGALIDCMPSVLMKNIVIYPWEKEIRKDILKEVNFMPAPGELPLFVLVFRRSWYRFSERPMIISSKAVYLPKKHIYALSDIYRNYFDEKRGRIHLKNFAPSPKWEKAAIHLIEASMLIFGGGFYDEELLHITTSPQDITARSDATVENFRL